jgi:DNA primase
MGKLAQATSKYTVFARFNADGTVEKPDIIGAVFGQTEGLLGQEMDLRELQKTGRIGRIDVELRNQGGKTNGMITVPSSLDASETALIAACIETIERVGPCNAKIVIEKIEDVRVSKRKYVIERARELLQKMFDQGDQEMQQISEQIKESVRKAEIVKYRGVSAGPNVVSGDDIIIVEGRADVVNLLRCGIKNAIAIEGTSVPPAVAELTKNKETTVFLDGDRGGDLILKELQATSEIDFVARAPFGKEVEEITKKEIFKALREKTPAASATFLSEAKDYKPKKYDRRAKPTTRTDYKQTKPPVRKKIKIDPSKSKKFKEILDSLVGTRAACLLDDSGEVIGKVPVSSMLEAIKETGPMSLIFDGNIEQNLLDTASKSGVKYMVGMKLGQRVSFPSNMFTLTAEDLK